MTTASTPQQLLYAAIISDDVDAVKQACALPGVDPNADTYKAIFLATARNNVPVLEYLCGLPGVDPAVDNNYAVWMAAFTGSLDTLKFLCTLPGVDPCVNGNCALESAIVLKHYNVAQYLCSILTPSQLEAIVTSKSHLQVVREYVAKAFKWFNSLQHAWMHAVVVASK